MPLPQTDLTPHVLRPSPAEVRDTRVLFYTRYATDLSEAQIMKFGYTVFYHKAVCDSLRGLGLDVTPASDPERMLQDLDFEFIYFTQIDGAFQGHEVLIPAIAGFRGIPFLGPPAPMRALSEDKVLGKAMAASLGVEVAKHHVIDPQRPSALRSFPPGQWVLKPRTGVMSRDITFVEGEAGWRTALAKAAAPRHLGREFIAEAYVPGLNLSAPVVEGFPAGSLPVFVEQGEARRNILTTTGKEGKSLDYAAEPYTGPGAAEASRAAAKLAAAMAPLDYARFDFRFEPVANRLVFLEVNMNCAMGPDSVVARAAAMGGVEYPDLVGHVFTHSLRRQRRGKGS
jgi:D-alanine-D-alanine ligase